MELDALTAAVDDFQLALQGPSAAAEASSVLRSYLEELQQAPLEALEALVDCFHAHLLTWERWGPADLPATLCLHHELEGLLAAQPAVCSRLLAAWQALLPAVLHGSSTADPNASSQLLTLERLHAALPLVLRSCAGAAGSSLWQRVAAAHSGICESDGSVFVGVLYLYLFCTQQCDSSSDSEPPPVLQQLLSALVPHLFGSDPTLTEETTQQAFLAALAVLQSEAVRARLSDMAEQQRRAACSRALCFLQRFQGGPSSLAADIWWSVFGAVVHQLVAMARQGRGLAALHHPQMAPLLRTLCAGTTADMLVLYLLSHPAHVEAKDGPRRAFALAAALLQHDVPALLEGCCSVLRPESNHALAVRIEALQAMIKACDAFLISIGNDKEERLKLWTTSSMQSLLFALSKDPSIRVRREAVKLLSAAAARVGSIEEQQLLHAICLRCRDRDEQVRVVALKMLLQFPAASLHANLSPEEWFTILHLGLPAAEGAASGAAGGAVAEAEGEERVLSLAPTTGARSRKGGVGGGGGGGSKHAQAIGESAQALLGMYLLPEEDGGTADAAAPEGGGGERLGSWLERLEALRRHFMEPAVQPGVEAAIAAALQQFITPEVVLQAAGHAA